ncbi:MAG: hypothetical protein U5L76_00865 [Patescibacteria group bacterium]|nr:hypothetical protein [Patescibacteria group bacterium]
MNEKVVKKLSELGIAFFDGKEFSLTQSGSFSLVAISHQSEEPDRFEIVLLKNLVEKLSRENSGSTRRKTLAGFNTYIFRKQDRCWTFCRRRNPRGWFPQKKVLSALIEKSLEYSS